MFRAFSIDPQNYETLGNANSNIPIYMLVLNLLGALAHGIGVGIAQTQGRRDFKLSTWMVQPMNKGNVTHPDISATLVFVGWIYPTTLITAFFGLSLAFHSVLSLFLTSHLIIGPSRLTNLYMRGLYYGVAPWVRYTYLVLPYQLLYLLGHRRTSLCV